jgi:hypothetical protein
MIIALNIGQSITPRRYVNPVMVSHWKYAKECASIGGGLMPGADLKIVAISKTPGQMWVQVELPGRHPPATLKIAGEEYANNFHPRS